MGVRPPQSLHQVVNKYELQTASVPADYSNDPKILSEMEGLKVQLASAHKALAEAKSKAPRAVALVADTASEREKSLATERNQAVDERNVFQSKVDTLNAENAQLLEILSAERAIREAGAAPVEAKEISLKEWVLEQIPGLAIGLGVGVLLCLLIR